MEEMVQFAEQLGRGDEARYGLYRLVPQAGGRPGPEQICTTSKEGIGPALVQLAEDRETDEGYEAEIIGVLDLRERRWITSLWQAKQSSS